MFYIKLLLIYLLYSSIILSNDFNILINPTKIELDLKNNSVTDIYLINNGEKTIKLLPYFETPIEFQNKSLETVLECFPKFIVLKPKEQKIVKLEFKKNQKLEFKRNEKYKSYIIFKELPSDSKSVLNKDTIILNEVGIGITGQN